MKVSELMARLVEVDPTLDLPVRVGSDEADNVVCDVVAHTDDVEAEVWGPHVRLVWEP